MNKENYRKIYPPVNSTLYSVQNKEYKWGVVDDNDNVMVEFGKYAWIDGFQNGLAKVIGFEDNDSLNTIGCFDDNRTFVEAKDMPKHFEQGIINENGEEVLPLEYNIWKFYGKDFPTIKVFKDGVQYKYYFEELLKRDDDKINIDNETEELPF